MDVFVDWSRREWSSRYRAEAWRHLQVAHRGAARETGHVLLLDGNGVDPARVAVRRLPGRFALPDAIARASAAGFEALRRGSGGRLHDGPVVRLCGVAPGGDGWSLAWQEAGYFDYARSNLMMDRREGEASLRDLVHADGALPEPGRSHLADAVGLALLLVTVDGLLVVQRRSRGVSVWPETWGPSAAGMATPEDFEDAPTLAALWPLREAAEELGLDAGLLRATPVRFLGLTRELARGGAPEMLFAVRLPVDRQAVLRALEHAPDAAEHSELLFLPLDDRDALLDRLGDEAAPSLLAGLALLRPS
jgi:hypothetical protein